MFLSQYIFASDIRMQVLNYNDTGGGIWTINHMYKKFTLHPMVNILVGKTAVPLVKNLNPSVFGNVNIIEPVGPWLDNG